jgi:hypothetical protein
MKSSIHLRSLIVLAALLLFSSAGTMGKGKNAGTPGKSGSADLARLTIVVTGGEDKKPVDSASVYVRFVEERKLGKDKKIEMNLKTNLSGTCHVDGIPQGKILIQVIAPGWKTFGEYFDVDQSEKTFSIALVRPPKWY